MRSLLAPQEPLAPGLPGAWQQRNGGRAGGTHRRGASDGNFPGPAPGHGRRGAGANPRQTDTSSFSGRKLLRAARPLPVFRGVRAPNSGDGPAATHTAKRGSAPRGTARPGPGPVPGRPSASPAVSLAAGGGKGGTATGEGERPAPARPPSRRGGTRGGSYLWRSWGRLGGGGGIPRLGAPLRASLSGGSAPRGAGAWLMAAARTIRGGPCGGRRGWPRSPRPRRREGGWQREGREGAEDRPWRQPRSPRAPPPGWRRRDRQPPATEPALPEGCGHRRGRPVLRGAPEALAGPEGGAGGAPGPAPPGRRARSLPLPPAPARREGPTPRGSPAALPCIPAGTGWLGRTCLGQVGSGAPGPARDGTGSRAW